jgi:hypothetical protein
MLHAMFSIDNTPVMSTTFLIANPEELAEASQIFLQDTHVLPTTL